MLNILIQPYNNFSQNAAGGVQTRVREYYKALCNRNDCHVEFFDKLKHKIEEWDIIHFFKLSIEHYDLMIYAKNKGVKIVISSIVPLQDGLKILTHRLLCKIIPLHTILDINSDMLSISTLILTESKSESKFLKKFYGVPFSKIRVLPNGISEKILSGDLSLARNKFKTDKFVLQVGRIDENKNQLNVIRSLKGTDISLIIVGGPDPLHPEYFEKCKKEAGENIIFTGWIPQTDPMIASLYAAAKVVLLPSFRETFGNVILEGAACGANIVYSNTLPIKELNLGSGTWTVTPNDISDIQRKIKEAFYSDNDPKLKARVLSEFTWEHIAEKHFQLFENLHE